MQNYLFVNEKGIMQIFNVEDNCNEVSIYECNELVIYKKRQVFQCNSKKFIFISANCIEDLAMKEYRKIHEICGISTQ